MKKIVVVMTYYNRAWQLRNTLESIDAFNVPGLEIVIVDDGSPYSDINPVVASANRHVVRIDPANKQWRTPTPAQNMGVQKALNLGADILILQNSECRWVGNIAEYANNVLTQENYLSFACYSLDKDNTYDPQLMDKLPEIIVANDVGATGDGQNAWYNHHSLRPVGYDFCSAITRENILKLNGYDERYKDGVSYSDDGFLMNIKRLGLEIEIPEPFLTSIHIQGEPFVLHQWHYENGSPMSFDSPLGQANKQMYDFIAENEKGNYRAIHLITPDLVDGRALVNSEIKEA